MNIRSIFVEGALDGELEDTPEQDAVEKRTRAPAPEEALEQDFKYYGSQTDLLNEIESDFLAQLDESLALIPEQEGAVASVLANLYEQRTTFCTLVRAIPSHEFATHLFSLPGINGLFKNLAIASSCTKSQTQYTREFIFQGTFAVLCSWLSSENPEPVSEIAEMLELLKDKLL